VRFKTEFEKSVLINNFEARGFKRTESEREWNFFWATVHTARSLFGASEAAQRLADDQILNHFPTHLELTRKDLMVKNLKRYRRDMDKLGQTDATAAALAAAAAADGSAPPVAVSQPLIDFFPLTYTLPGEYAVFADEFRRSLALSPTPGSVVWIVKPNARSQGKGIELLHKASQLKKWAQAASAKSSEPGAQRQHSYVVSRYIADPLLIGGRKFDLRLYCLVTRYRPTLKAWVYREGFARFCNVKYASGAHSLGNSEMHLTNVAIQKHGEGYNDAHGNKWSLANLRLYLTATRGAARTQACFEQMDFIFIHALRSVAPVMSGDKHCFELYGFDMLLDSALKPWLLEVNASPSLSVTTRADRRLKGKLIRDMLAVVVPPDFPDTKTSRGSTSWNQQMQVGGFELLYDEALMNAAPASNAAGAAGTTAAGEELAGAARSGAAGAGRPATSTGASGVGGSASSSAGGGVFGLVGGAADAPPKQTMKSWR